MGWGDDLLKGVQNTVTNTAQAAAANVTQSATDFFNKKVSSGLEAIGSKPLGNLSQAEIDDGETGATYEHVVSTAKAISPVMIAGAAVAAYFIFGRGKK